MKAFLLMLSEPEVPLQGRELAWARVVAGTSVASGHAPAERLAGLLEPQDTVVVLVPGERVLLHAIQLVAPSRAARLQALPYALEDRLSEDLEAMHIVAGPNLPDGRLLGAAVAHRDMAAWHDGLKAIDIAADHLLPDTFLLPQPTDSAIHIHASGDRCLVAAPDGERVVLQAELLGWWLQRRGDQASAEGAQVVWHGAPETAPPGLAGLTGFSSQPWDGDLFALLAPALRVRPALDLLAGRYASRRKRASGRAGWRWPALTAALAGAVAAASLWYDIHTLDRHVDNLEQATAEVFEMGLPGVRMVDPVAQFRQALAAGSVAPLAETVGMSEEIARAAPMMLELGAQLQRLRADADRLELDMHIDSIAALDRLRARLQEDARVTVEIHSAEADATGVRARLLLARGRS